jgi:hypothetical protein
MPAALPGFRAAAALLAAFPDAAAGEATPADVP